jgi:hypothetical protein
VLAEAMAAGVGWAGRMASKRAVATAVSTARPTDPPICWTALSRAPIPRPMSTSEGRNVEVSGRGRNARQQGQPSRRQGRTRSPHWARAPNRARTSSVLAVIQHRYQHIEVPQQLAQAHRARELHRGVGTVSSLRKRWVKTTVGTGPAEPRHATSSCWIQVTVKQRRAAGRSSGTGWSNGVARSPNPVTSKPAIGDVLCAAGVLAGGNLPKARGATLRRKLVAAPARLARPQRKTVLYLPDHCPGPSTPHLKPSGGRAGGAPTTHRPGSVDSGLESRSCPPRQAWAYKPPAAVRPKLRDGPAIELRHRPIPYTRLSRPSGNCSTLCSSIACRADDENNALPSPTISG